METHDQRDRDRKRSERDSQGSIFVSPWCVIKSGKAATVSVVEMSSVWMKTGD